MANNDFDRINAAVIARMFEAIDMLIAAKKVRGLKTITDMYGLNRPNLIRLRNDPKKKFYPYYMWILVIDFGVSARWLVAGQGNMFTVDPHAPMPQGWEKRIQERKRAANARLSGWN